VGNKESLDSQEIIIYLSGILIAGTAGVLLLKRIIRLENDSDLESYYGHIYEHPKIGTLFFISCLGIVGFPLTPTFLGIDIILSHIDRNQWGMIALLGLTYLFMEIAALRIFSRLFLGPHRKAYHEIAFKSS
jgi:formate hydrogenlyase subunit 3/multisubunit Na+/H+ antiporter MnhD subunit